MIIKDVHIDNYGKYSDRSFDGFSEGVNVIYGPNEHGKTTLLEFIRRMLFGFPQKNARKNRFEPVNGDNPGGKLCCTLDSGEELIIERSGWRKGGAVKLNSENASPQDLSQILRASELFFQNVYAITIDELYSVDSLNEEDIKTRIYGAGLDLGNVSLAAVQRHFQSKADDIFKPRGSNQQIHLLNEKRKDIELRINEAKGSLERYSEIISEKNELESETTRLKDQIKAVNNKIAELSRKCSAFQEFIDYEEAAAKLKALPENSGVTREDIEEFQNLKREHSAVYTELKKLQNLENTLNQKIESTNVNRSLLELASEVTMLERSAERYRADSAGCNELRSRISSLKTMLDEKRQDMLSLFQNETDLENFSFELDYISRTNDFKQKFNDLRQQEVTAMALRETGKNQSGNVAGVILTTSVLFGIFAAIVIIALIYTKPAMALWTALIACVPFTFIIISLLNKYKSAQNSKTGDTLEQRKAEIVSSWKKLLEEKGFKAHLNPEDILKCAEIYKDFERNHIELKNLESELKDKEIWLENIESTLQQAGKTLDKKNLTNDLIADIEIISRSFKTAEKTDAELKRLNDEKVNNQGLIEVAKNKLEEIENASASLLKKFEVDDFNSLKQSLDESIERRGLEKLIDESFKRLKNIFGVSIKIEDIREVLKDFSGEIAEMELGALEQDRMAFEENLAILNRRTGELNSEESRLVSEDKLTSMHNEHARLIQQIRDHALRWAGFKAAEILIKKAVKKYEQERQPEVIRRAAEIFADLTGGEYASVRKSAESEDLQVFERNGASRSVIQLSRGTREQLYLAMRLGLIEQYEEKTEKLPVMFDDILVNFDQTRLQAAVEAIFKFAHKRQVIVLTCHENIHSMFLKYGAQDIKVF